ncbi:MAG: repeat-containing protein [Hyphomicrobiales bacterium]|nr:repeat-containing protein [Hyphomicrobiales bacterium]
MSPVSQNLRPATLVSFQSAKHCIAASIAALVLWAPAAEAQARQVASISAPFDLSMSAAGTYLSAYSAGAQRDTAAAATFFREALRFDPRNAELMERAFVAALANGNVDDGFALADKLLQRDPKNGLANLVTGVKAMKGKRFVVARGSFAKGGGGRQRDITATLLTGWSYFGSGDSKRAIETLDKLKDARFGLFRDYHVALMADLANQRAEAVKRIKAAYEAEKTTLRVVDAYARIMARSGDVVEAKRAYDAFDQLLPRHPIIRAGLAELASGKPMGPVVNDAEQGAAEVLYGLGSVGGSQNDELAAMIYLRLALYMDPKNALAVVTLADVYERLKQNDQAIDVYKMVPASSPLKDNSEIQVGLLLETAGRSEEAQKHLGALADAHPKDPETLLALANLQRSRKQFVEAADTYTRVLEVSGGGKTDWSTLYFRGVSYERQKKWPLAEADFRKALEYYPDQPMVLNYLGYSLVDQGLKLDEAFKLLRRAVELRPTDGYVIDSLAWAYYRLGQFPEAVRELEKAIELKPADPVINDHLGDAYWRVGRKLEARFQWNHARDLNPEPEELPKILAKIDNGLTDEPAPAAASIDPPKVEEPKNGG